MLESQNAVVDAHNLLSEENLNLVEWTTCFQNLEAVITDSELIDRCRMVEDISLSERGSLAADIASKGPFSTWITRTRLIEISGSLAKRVVPPADIVTLSDESVGKLWDPVNETYVSGHSEREVVESIESLLSEQGGKSESKLNLAASTARSASSGTRRLRMCKKLSGAKYFRKGKKLAGAKHLKMLM